MKKPIPLIIGAVILYAISTGASYFFFSSGNRAGSVSFLTKNKPEAEHQEPPEGPVETGIGAGLPKTEVCPLNGKLYSEPEREIWETRRPMAVMIENSVDSRPHSGLSKADIVYEAIAEGGITRFMGVFYCGLGDATELAPVRSARTYFLDWASEYSPNPLYVHVGGANCSRDEGTGQCTSDPRVQALEQIQKYGWYGSTGNDLNQFALSFPICFRNPDRIGRPVATEHQMVCQSDKLYEKAADRGWTNVDEDGEPWDETYTAWDIKEEASEGERGQTTSISFSFWDGKPKYDVTWEYNAAKNEYMRLTGGEAHNDIETDRQLSAKNVVIQFSKETQTGDIHKHLLYKTTGTNDALIFQDGAVIEGTWSKKNRLSRTKFFDDKGKEIKFNPGVIWVEVLPDRNIGEVSY
jgi:hypothetical protein